MTLPLMRHLLNLLLLTLLLIPDTFAGFRTTVHSISRREGLSNGAVNTIAKDAEGYIWLGTWNGLNRYNGHSIETFLPGGKPYSIHNHVIRELYPTSAGSVWMLTNKGIARYDNIRDRFFAYFTNEPEQINYENDIALTHSARYGTLASVFGRGLFRYNEQKDLFVPLILNKFSTGASLKVKRVHLVDEKLFCITATGELLQQNGDRLETLMQLPITGTLTSSMLLQIGVKPYLFITQRTGAALMVDPETLQTLRLRIPDDVITSIAVSRQPGKLWAGTEKGRIYSYNLQSNKFEELKIVNNLYSGNPIATRILSIYETDPDILWIGTDGNGVFTLKLTEFPATSLSSGQLSYPIVRCILVTRNKDILVGTKGGGIDVFDINGKLIRQISVKDGLSNNSVLSFHERKDGSIWVGTDGSGIDILSPDYHRIRNFPGDFKETSALQFSSVYRILEDSDGKIYLGTSGFGVIAIDFDIQDTSMPSGCSQLLLDRSIETGQQKQIVYALAVEKPGIIWVGTRGFGVYRYNTITKRVIAQYTSISDPDFIRNDDILTLFTDQNGIVWVGSSSGIFSLTPVSADSAKVGGLSVQSDLFSTSIHTIQSDHSGNLWVTTNQGLSLIDKNRRNVQSFNVNDGLINFEYSDGASFFDVSDGRLFVGGTMGVDIVQTKAIRLSSYFPPLAFNQLMIRNLPVEIGKESVLQSRINHQKDLELKYNQNAFSFSVTPLAYWGQERHRISYRLVNFDDQWTINPLNQPIAFSNLEAGEYLLQVRVSDENGVWSDQVREIKIVINPPFWRTSWAIVGYVVLFFLIQFLIFLAYRRRAARKKETALREFEQKKEEELQSYKIEFFTNVAHEFRTPLTLITSHIHALIEDKKLTTENPRLLKVYNNSLKLQKLVLEIMQFRKLEKGKEPLNIQIVRPFNLVQEVVSDLELLAQQRSIICRVDAETEEMVFKTDADKFQRILTNLISNAIKYNREEGFVIIKIRMDGNSLLVEVEDEGVGIKTEYLSRVFEPFGISSAKKRGSFPGYRSTGIGLAVTKGLVELLKGTISLESHPGKGTRFTCLFPDVHQVNSAELINEPAFNEFGPDFIDPDAGETEITDVISSKGKPLLLLADDDPEILILLRDFLQSDYNIIFAENGSEAYFKILDEKPDLIVSDVMMPETDGIELCNKLRENFDTSHIPIILLTAKAEIEDRIAGLKAGADSYIPKPFHPDHLKVRIEKLLQFRTGIRNHFGRQYDNSTLIKEIPDPFFIKMLAYIDENLDDESLSAEKLCDKLAISKSSLYNKTKSVLGTTPHGLINQQRLSKAASLMLTTQLTVSEIIDQTGFASRTHFYDLFGKAYGCSPSEYRNKTNGG